MAHQAVQEVCNICDHQMVPGVACDGQFEECPHHLALGTAATGLDFGVYAEEVLDLAQPGEFDAVRGES
ncbi:MAG: hypothetical protein PVF91_06875 [Chromatiales bacterium]|jgi:hypothetical protein